MTESDLHPNAKPDYLVNLLFQTAAILVFALILLGISAWYPSLINPQPSDSPVTGALEADGRFRAPDPLIGVDRHIEEDRTFASLRNQLHTGFAAPTP